jgi:hypothetical protein
MLKKNTAGQFLTFVLIKIADGLVLTGASPTGYVTLDDSAQTGIGGSIAETANGQYRCTLSQGDTNGDEVGYLFTAATAIAVNLVFTTETKKMVDLNDFAVDGEVTLKDNAITASKYDESTAFPIAAEDANNTYLARTGADGDTLEVLSDEHDALPTDANVTTQCALALSNAHLDHLLLTAYAGEGTVGSILKDLLEDDGGTYRFNANALEEGMSGAGDASDAKQDEILADLVDIKGTGFTKDVDSLKFVALRGTDNDTLKDLSEEIAAIVGTATVEKQDEILVDLVDIKGTSFVKDTHSLYDIQTELVVVDGNVDQIETLVNTIDGNVDDIETLVTTIDGNVDDVETLVTTIDGKCDTISTAVVTTLDGIVDAILVDTVAIEKLLRADFVVDENESPFEYLLLEEGTPNVLVTKQMFEVDDTDIDAVTQVVGKMLQP